MHALFCRMSAVKKVHQSLCISVLISFRIIKLWRPLTLWRAKVYLPWVSTWRLLWLDSGEDVMENGRCPYHVMCISEWAFTSQARKQRERDRHRIISSEEMILMYWDLPVGPTGPHHPKVPLSPNSATHRTKSLIRIYSRDKSHIQSTAIFLISLFLLLLF
jgi:hypothetical protein